MRDTTRAVSVESKCELACVRVGPQVGWLVFSLGCLARVQLAKVERFSVFLGGFLCGSVDRESKFFLEIYLVYTHK